MARMQLTAAQHEPRLPRAARRAGGIYYTPAEVVRYIVERALTQLLRSAASAAPPRVLDPACGAGAFLVGAYEELLNSAEGELSTRHRLALLRNSIFGIDLDPAAIERAKASLAAIALGGATNSRQLASVIKQLSRNLVAGDALLGDAESLGSLARGSFDCILGNPPYVNIRQIAKTLPLQTKARLRDRFRSARGNYDLYVLFLERALELLRPGGRCGMIVPNKFAGLDYARPCRSLLLAETSIEHIADLSALRIFPAAEVYPIVLVCSKQSPPTTHEVEMAQINSDRDLQNGPAVVRIRQTSLSPDRFMLRADLELESRVATRPLGECGALHSGASGYTASRLAELLVEKDAGLQDGESELDFIVSRNIKRYCITLRNVRFLKRVYSRPGLMVQTAGISAAKRRLYSKPKIVIAGMSRRIEAAYDERGLALGVQVYAIARMQVDPFFLLALLNSQLMTHLFQTRFAAKRLAGGYYSVNKSQLAQLPIPCVADAAGVPMTVANKLSQLARRVHEGADSSLRDAAEAEIDRLVYQLYRLTPVEIEPIEARFAAEQRRAA